MPLSSSRRTPEAAQRACADARSGTAGATKVNDGDAPDLYGMTGREGVTSPAPSGTVTFLFSDIEGSTQRWDRDRSAMQEAVRLHDHLVRAAIAAHGGHVFKTVGDAFCAAFTTPESATRAAIDAQHALASADFSAVDGLRVRMAINTGTADERDGDYFGPTLNRVARLLSLGHGGQVLLSGIAADLVRENPPPHATLTELGAHVLKDLERHEQVYQLVAPGLERSFPELRAPRVHQQPWIVPDAMHTRYFTGREDLLAQIRAQLMERRRAVLSGLGGVGKTQTAIEYALRHRNDYPHGVFWVNAEAASGLTGGFVEIAKTLRLPVAASNDQEQVVRAMVEWLGATDRWLLILDNVEDRREVARFVPAHGEGDLLITSRESVFAELGVPRALEVRDFESDEAVRFLLVRTGRDESEAAERYAATELAGELGNLPLALEQAAAYVAETSATFSAYLSAFRKRRVALLEKASALVSHQSVAITWAANFEAVERVSPAAADILRLSAFLAPDGIPFEIFEQGAQALGAPIAEAVGDADELAMPELLRPLAHYSLVRSDAASRAFGVHRLVQEIVRVALGELESRAQIARAIAAVSAALPAVEYGNWAQCDRLVPHVESIAGWVEAYGVLSDVGTRVLNGAGRYLFDRGRYAEAQRLLEKALAIGQRTLGPDHVDVAASLNHLAVVYLYHGRHAEAQSLHERALAIRERELGHDHPQVAASLGNLANVYFHWGRYAQAEPLYRRALAVAERALGPDHPIVANNLNNLARVHDEEGRYAEAEALHERALAIRERALAPDHPHVALSLNNLGTVYWHQGRYTEAASLHERALAIRERVLGPDHSDVAESLHELGLVRLEQGRHADAEQLHERALGIYERAVGPDHQWVAQSLNGLATARLRQGRYVEARPLYDRALTIAARALDPEHPDVARSLHGLATVHLNQGKHAEAEPLHERALAIRERALGPDHPGVAESLVGLASLRAHQGRVDDALVLLERALAVKKPVMETDHPELAEIRSKISALRADT